jgi:ABC-type sugar transport system substrate-binding protein
MTIVKQGPTRRALLGAAAVGAAFGALPGLIRPAAAAGDFKIGLFIALSGPASLFGPTQKACAELATEEINKAGGILGRQIKLIPTDAGGPPAESTKSAIRLMLEENVDMFVGSHDSATREALVATIKGKVPYIYTPVYEGGECAFNTYVIADTPEQQIRPSVAYMMKDRGAKSVYLIGDDYVWPRKCNEHAKKYVAENGGSIVAEEYVPFGAPNKFEEIVTRIKSAKPDMVLITLVGAEPREQQQSVLLDVLLCQRARRSEQEVQGSVFRQVRRQGAAARPDRRRLLRRHLLRAGARHQGRRHRRQEVHGGIRRVELPDRGRDGDHARPPCRQDHVPRHLQGHRVRYHQDLCGREERRRVQGLARAAG